MCSVCVHFDKQAGEVARGVGQGALGAVDKTKEMNQKYRELDTVNHKDTTMSGWSSFVRSDITEKTTEAAKATYNKAVDFEQKHHVSSSSSSSSLCAHGHEPVPPHVCVTVCVCVQIGEKVGKGFQWMGDKAKEAEQKYHITDRVTEGAKTATQLVERQTDRQTDRQKESHPAQRPACHPTRTTHNRRSIHPSTQTRKGG